MERYARTLGFGTPRGYVPDAVAAYALDDEDIAGSTGEATAS